MKKLCAVSVLSLLLVGCGEAPPPEGPAAEATTPEVEVTMPDSTDATTEPTGEADPAASSATGAPANPNP